MASAARQLLRRQNQLIKFPNRIRIHKNPSPNNSAPEISPTIAAMSQSLPHLKPLNPTSAFISYKRSPSVDDARMFESLPPRYRRRTISQEEMEFIERGGPE